MKRNVHFENGIATIEGLGTFIPYDRYQQEMAKVGNDVLARRVKQLTDILTAQGICIECGQLFEHWVNEPMASCGCGQSEWGSANLTPYMQLQFAGTTKDAERDALVAQVEAWKAVSGKHLEVASDCIESNRRLLLKTFIAGCDVGHKYGENPFEHDRQFDSFMADLKAEQQKFYRQEIEYINFSNQSTKGIKMIKPPSPKQELEFSKVLHNRIEELEKERNELKAQVEHLRVAATVVLNARDEDGITTSGLLAKFDELSKALSFLPVQCLAEIKAQAGWDGFIECYFSLRKVQHSDVFDLVKAADEYANQIRQQAKDGAA